MVGIRSKLVVIGNSIGVRLPKTLLEQTQITGEVELIARPFCIIIRAVNRPRASWDDQFASENQLHPTKNIDSSENPSETAKWQW